MADLNSNSKTENETVDAGQARLVVRVPTSMKKNIQTKLINEDKTVQSLGVELFDKWLKSGQAA